MLIYKGAFIEPCDGVKGLTEIDIRNYNCQYLNEEDVLKSLRFDDELCEDCEFITNEPDIHCANCPADFEVGAIDCAYWWKYSRIKRILIQADVLLRNTLGDLWTDEYTS